MENSKLERNKERNVKLCIKIDKAVIKFGNTEAGNTNFNNIKFFF